MYWSKVLQNKMSFTILNILKSVISEFLYILKVRMGGGGAKDNGCNHYTTFCWLIEY